MSYFGVYDGEALLMILAYIGTFVFVFVCPFGLGFVAWHQIDKLRPYARTVMVPEGEPDPVPPRRRWQFRTELERIRAKAGAR